MTNILEELLKRQVRIHVSAAGAGAGIQSRLWGIPGASQFLEGATFPYSKEGMTRFLGYCPEKFVSQRTAIDMAISAYLLASNGDPSITPIGLGLTASVATLKEHRGEHKVCVAAITRTQALYAEVVLPKGTGNDARGLDGRFSDEVALEVLLKSAGVELNLPSWQATQIQDVMPEARASFFERPFFRRDGTRLQAPVSQGLTMFPGAFNPPHEGHFYNADESVVFQITANTPRTVPQGVDEASVPHKAPLALGDMLDRLYWLRGKRDSLFLENSGTFLEKARQFPGTLFIIGSDTMSRILDPKWGHEVAPTLQEFHQLGVRFRVSMRNYDNHREILEGARVPERFWPMFQELPPSPYATLSSTKVREAKL